MTRFFRHKQDFIKDAESTTSAQSHLSYFNLSHLSNEQILTAFKRSVATEFNLSVLVKLKQFLMHIQEILGSRNNIQPQEQKEMCLIIETQILKTISQLDVTERSKYQPDFIELFNHPLTDSQLSALQDLLKQLNEEAEPETYYHGFMRELQKKLHKDLHSLIELNEIYNADKHFAHILNHIDSHGNIALDHLSHFINSIQLENDLPTLIKLMTCIHNGYTESQIPFFFNRRTQALLLAHVKIKTLLACFDSMMQKPIHSDNNRLILQSLKNQLVDFKIDNEDQIQHPYSKLIEFKNMVKQAQRQLDEHDANLFIKFFRMLLNILSLGLMHNRIYENNYIKEDFDTIRKISSGAIANITTDPSNLNLDKTLYIHSSGGSGHTSAMQYLQEMHLKEDLAYLVQSQVTYSPTEWSELEEKLKAATAKMNMLDELVPFIGPQAVKQVNYFHQTKNIRAMEITASMQPVAEKLFSLPVYNSVYQYLIDHPEIESVADTQILCTKTICQAILDVNEITGRHITYDKYMTDMPTDKSKHFFSSLNVLNREEASLLRFHTYLPLIKISEGTYKAKHDVTETDIYQFFRKHIGPYFNLRTPKNPHGNLIIEDRYPIRAAFQFENLKDRTAIQQIPIQVNSEAEQLLLTEHQQLHPTQIEHNGSQFQLALRDNDLLCSVMLGSLGTDAIAELAQKFASLHNKLIQESVDSPRLVLMLYCGNSKDGQGHTIPSQIYQNVTALIRHLQNEQAYDPRKLLILPLGNQPAQTISDNYCRADLHIGRSGGISSMELLECMRKNSRLKLLILLEKEGLVKWELGNAHYLMNYGSAENKPKLTLLDDIAPILEQFIEAKQFIPAESIYSAVLH